MIHIEVAFGILTVHVQVDRPIVDDVAHEVDVHNTIEGSLTECLPEVRVRVDEVLN
jgi:hypothetical protein